MRVCHICNSFPPMVGGHETHNYSVVKFLSERGHKVDVILVRPPKKWLISTNYDDQTIETLSRPSYTLPDLPSVIIHTIPAGPFKTYYQLFKKVLELEKTGRIDVLDIHSYHFAIPFSKKRKIILSVHSYALSCARANPPLPCSKHSFKRCRKCCGTLPYLYWKLTRYLALQRIPKFMVKYEYLKQKMTENGIESDKIIVIPHWIDVDWINSASKDILPRSSIGLDDSDIVFSFLGRLTKVNGLDLLLESFRLLCQSYDNARLILIGEGELRDEIRSFCQSNGLEGKVKLIGMVPHSEVPRYLSLADIHVMPQCECNNYNWVLLEVMSTEKPIIATEVAGTAEILKHGYNALLTKPNPESIAARMIELIENPELGKKLATNALKTVKARHGMENLLRYEELLKEL